VAPLALWYAARAVSGLPPRNNFEIVAVIEASRASGHLPQSVEVGRAVDIDDAANAGNDLPVRGGRCHLPAGRSTQQHEPIAVDAQISRVGPQERDGCEKVVALRRPPDLRRETVVDRRHRVPEPGEPVVEPARGAAVQPVAAHPAPAVNHDHTRPR
jgi:hypothetical protein